MKRRGRRYERYNGRGGSGKECFPASRGDGDRHGEVSQETEVPAIPEVHDRTSSCGSRYERADSDWDAQTDPAKLRGQYARQMGAETAARPARPVATNLVPQTSIKKTADTPRDARTDSGEAKWQGFLPVHMPCERAAKGPDHQVPTGKMQVKMID